MRLFGLKMTVVDLATNGFNTQGRNDLATAAFPMSAGIRKDSSY
jgi:hypothetical protein